MSSHNEAHKLIADAILSLATLSKKQSEDMADIRSRTAKLSTEIAELKKWAASLPKSSDSDFSHTRKPI